jgi:hypothetical protein
MNSKKLQKIGGASAILEACIYIVAFIVYGGILVFPAADVSATEKVNFLSENYAVLSILNFLSYVVFGIVLAIFTLAIYERFKNFSPRLSKLTAIFGFTWVVLVIASGMIANIGLQKVVSLLDNDSENAIQIWSSISIITEGLGGGNEIVGGIWVLLISYMGLDQNIFSKPLNLLGIIVGFAGVFTVYPLEIFTEIFGITQIVWFLWIGIAMIKKPIERDI